MYSAASPACRTEQLWHCIGAPSAKPRTQAPCNFSKPILTDGAGSSGVTLGMGAPCWHPVALLAPPVASRGSFIKCFPPNQILAK